MRTIHASDQHGEYDLTGAKEARWPDRTRVEWHNTHAGLGASVIQLTFTDRSQDCAVIIKRCALYSCKARGDLKPHSSLEISKGNIDGQGRKDKDADNRSRQRSRTLYLRTKPCSGRPVRWRRLISNPDLHGVRKRRRWSQLCRCGISGLAHVRGFKSQTPACGDQNK